MTQWDWLAKPQTAYTWSFALRVIIKAALLFALANSAFALVKPLPALGQVSLYNRIFHGRERLPYGEDAGLSYNLSLYNLDAMLASQKLATGKSPDEFRVLLMGDSAVWGFLLENKDTLTARINAQNLTLADGRRVRAHNLGYPIMSLTKDLLLLDYAMRYQPDLVVWLMTLESFPRDKQLFPPLVQNNAERVRQLIAEYDLNLDPQDTQFVNMTLADETIVGRRRDLADWLRLQLYGVPWSITGIDQYIPAEFQPRQEDFEPDVSWQGIEPPTELTEDYLAFDVLDAGIAHVGATPILLVNEPMFISSGRNSDLRYNFFYPRWAYDTYRELLGQTAEAQGWRYIDLWDAISPDEFTDSAVHMTPAGSDAFSKLVGAEIVEFAYVLSP